MGALGRAGDIAVVRIVCGKQHEDGLKARRLHSIICLSQRAWYDCQVALFLVVCVVREMRL